MVVDPRAATGFVGAEDYERGRPGYPPAAIELVLGELALTRESTVLDLAAGTGQLARLLLGRVGELIAVEPAAEMRAQFAVRLPDVVVLDGTAEAMTLVDESVDAVVVGEAFHWFDITAAAGELARVLRPCGGLALLWNVPIWTARDTPWLPSFQQLVAHHKAAAGCYPAGAGHWQPLLEGTGRFEPLTPAQATHVQRLSPADFLAQVSSWSWITNLPQSQHRSVLSEVEGLVGNLAEISIPYRTDIFWTRRRGC